MNEIQFIQQHGVDKAREVVSGAPERATHLFNGEYVRVSDPRWFLGDYVSITELKRLVENVDLVKAYSGIKQCHKEVEWVKDKKLPETTIFNVLKQAIADYEEIYSDDDSDLEYHVSKNCKVIDYD